MGLRSRSPAEMTGESKQRDDREDVFQIGKRQTERNHAIPHSGSKGNVCVSKIHVEHFDLLSIVRSDK